MVETSTQHPLPNIKGPKRSLFPTCSFMDAKVVHNKSHAWKSLMEAKRLIREGSGYIGNGKAGYI
jgi:hypothetical protein